MKRKIFSILSIIITMCIIFSMGIIPTEASTISDKMIDGSYLTNKDSSTGTTNTNVRGAHLMDGECSITKAGRGKIYVYSSTTGNHDVDYIATVIYVDQYNQETKHWEQIDVWKAEDFNTYYVATSKMLSVDSGYFYRVHADHVAGMTNEKPYEEATSATDGIWID